MGSLLEETVDVVIFVLLESSPGFLSADRSVVVGVDGIEGTLNLIFPVTDELVFGDFGDCPDGILHLIERDNSIVVTINSLEESDGQLIFGDSSVIISVGRLEILLDSFLPSLWELVAIVLRGFLDTIIGFLEVNLVITVGVEMIPDLLGSWNVVLVNLEEIGELEGFGVILEEVVDIWDTVLLDSFPELSWGGFAISIGVNALDSVFDHLLPALDELVLGEFGDGLDGIKELVKRDESIIVSVNSLEDIGAHLLWRDLSALISIGLLEFLLDHLLPSLWELVAEVLHGTLEGSLGFLKVPLSVMVSIEMLPDLLW